MHKSVHPWALHEFQAVCIVVKCTIMQVVHFLCRQSGQVIAKTKKTESESDFVHEMSTSSVQVVYNNELTV